MSFEGLSDFLNAAEHSASLRRAIRTCTNKQMLIDLASTYGFSIKERDLDENNSESHIIDWFKSSKISPIKKNK